MFAMDSEMPVILRLPHVLACHSLQFHCVAASYQFLRFMQRKSQLWVTLVDGLPKPKLTKSMSVLHTFRVLHVRVVSTLPSMQLQCSHLPRVPFGMCHGIGRSIAGALSKSSARYFPVGVACNSFATRFRNLSYDGIPTSRAQQRQSQGDPVKL